MDQIAIGPGMRVLDVGSGVGDVALLAARRVGPSGAVLGVECSPEAIAVARERATAKGLEWCRFVLSDIDAFETEESFDAVVGRLVLMYLPDPSATLRSLAWHLRPGGGVAFQELNISAVNAYPDGPEFLRICGKIMELFRCANVAIDMGPNLCATFRAAGLPDPRMVGAMQFVSDADPLGYEIFAAIVRSLLPQFERLGVASAAELGVETLAERLREESRRGGRVHLFPPLIGAWTRIPDA
jgi:ubiquinone/menaquinone biosynthesis C-methylase UbiE